MVVWTQRASPIIVAIAPALAGTLELSSQRLRRISLCVLTKQLSTSWKICSAAALP